jgi:hypothetical protein
MYNNKLNKNRYINQVDSTINFPGRSFIVNKDGKIDPYKAANDKANKSYGIETSNDKNDKYLKLVLTQTKQREIEQHQFYRGIYLSVNLPI